MQERHYYKWIFSPLEKVPDESGTAPEGFEYPIARYYALRWRAPMHHNGCALVRCEMGGGQLAKARQDKRLIVLDEGTVPDQVTKHHAELGTKEQMTMREMLAHLAQYHACFEE